MPELTSLNQYGKYILIIDDDELSRDVLCILLQAEGYHVECAASGDEAVERLAVSHPGIILADFQMPGLTGNELASRLRILYGASTRILAMSATEVPPPDISEYDAFLLKPFSPEDLKSLLKNPKKMTRHQNGLATHQNGTQAMEVPQEDHDPLNEDIFQKLHDYMSAPEIQQIYDFCLQDAYKRFRLMDQHILDHDDLLYRREAHNIKGSCGMLGATQLREIAAVMEANGIPADRDTDKSLRVSFLDASERLERILKTRTGRPS